jgi:hypothetical protein
VPDINLKFTAHRMSALFSHPANANVFASIMIGAFGEKLSRRQQNSCNIGATDGLRIVAR